MAKQKMVELTTIWKDRGIPKSLKVEILKCLIWASCTVRKRSLDPKKRRGKQTGSRRNVVLQTCPRRAFGTKTNATKNQQNRRRLSYVGHANRNTKTELMTTVLQGKLEAKRNSGRPPTSYINNIKSASGLKLHEFVWKSRDRRLWLSTVASSGAPTDESGDRDR